MNASTASPVRSRRFWLGTAVAGLAGAVFAACAGRPGHWGCGWHRGGHGFHHVDSLEEARERARSALGWVLREVDATEGQRERLRAIVDESVEQLYPLMERHHQNRRDLLEALARVPADRAELELLRRAELELADAASDRLLDAAVDALEVLSPEQRAGLIERARQHHR